jgi:hypothetical protein
MNEQDAKCPYGPDSDIDARYLAGTLSPAEAEAFEEHYFGCDACFAAVKRGTEIRAALAGTESEVAAGSRPDLHGRRRFSGWQPALAAAAAVVLVLGVQQMRGARGRPVAIPPVAAPADAARGSRTPLTLTSYATTTVLAAAWPPVTSAHTYRIRLLATDGSLLFERETADTAVMLSRDLVRDNSAVYWEVQALDALRSVVATSPVVQAQTSPSPP